MSEEGVCRTCNRARPLCSCEDGAPIVEIEPDRRDGWTTGPALRRNDRDYAVPWEPLPDERPEYFALFLEWCATAGETITKYSQRVADQTGYSAGHIQSTASRWRWRARRSAYLSALARDAYASSGDRMRSAASARVEAWIEAAEWALESIQVARANGLVLDPSDALAFLKATTSHARLEAGLATGRVQIDISDLDGDELDELDTLLAQVEDKIRIGSGGD